MSELAERERLVKRRWAVPGSTHDRVVGLLKIILPAAIGIVLAYLALAPLERGQEISFLLDKNKVDVASERMRLQTAQYRGQDGVGRPFVLNARSAVQATSAEPIVRISDMDATIQLDDGPARIEAGRLEYVITDVVVADVVRLIEPVVAPQIRGKQLAYLCPSCDRSLAVRADV
jgi:lipopolysaccharide export system protein LptC